MYNLSLDDRVNDNDKEICSMHKSISSGMDAIVDKNNICNASENDQKFTRKKLRKLLISGYYMRVH